MTREIILDTETTGLDPQAGDRLVEIGCIELANHLPTGRVFHTYLNPQRDVPPEAVRVHGLTAEFLKSHPLFTEKVGEFLDFLGDDATLVIHNAEFDMKFINAELKAAGFKPLPLRVIDTVLMAREKFPGQPASLDALCRRFKIDNSDRKFHGALLDSELLSEVYLELLGGRQHGLGLLRGEETETGGGNAASVRIKRQSRKKRSFLPSSEELALHEKFIAGIKNALWGKKSA